MAGFLKRVQSDLSQSHDHHHRSQREGNKYRENPTLHRNYPLPEKLSGAREGSRSPPPSATGYDAALMSVTWIVLVALFKVPVTSTFCPAKDAGFFWSLSL